MYQVGFSKQKAFKINIKIYLNFCNPALKFFLLLYGSIFLKKKIVKVRAILASEHLWTSLSPFFTSENFNNLGKAQMHKLKCHLLCEASLYMYYSSSLILSILFSTLPFLAFNLSL